MENNTSEQKKEFKINYLTVVLALIVAVPLIYFFFFREDAPAVPGTVTAVAATEGLENAKKAAAATPNHDTYFNLGYEYYKAGMYEECIAASNKALEFNPNSDVVYNNIGASYGALGKYDQEIAACEKALSINPANELAKNNLLWAQEQKTKGSASSSN